MKIDGCFFVSCCPESEQAYENGIDIDEIQGQLLFYIYRPRKCHEDIGTTRIPINFCPFCGVKNEVNV